MKYNIIILVIILALTGGWTYYADISQQKNGALPQKVENFEFETLDGQEKFLFEYKGKPIILHFWATWCAPCIKELPELYQFSKKENVYVIAMAVADKPADIQRFIEKKNIHNFENFIIGLDPDKKISKDIYETYRLPESFIIDADIILLHKTIGAHHDWSSDYWKKITDP